MRKLIILLLLGVLAYAGYDYFREYASRPLREKLLLTDTDRVTRIDVEGPDETLRFDRGEDGRWTVAQQQRLLYEQSPRVREWLTALRELRTDSIISAPLPGSESYLIVLHHPEGEERLSLNVRAADAGVVASVGSSPDYYALPPSVGAWPNRYLRFNAYRELRLFQPFPRIDSLVFDPTDSLAVGWTITSPDSLALVPYPIAPATAPPAPTAEYTFADHFNEIEHTDDRIGFLVAYSGATPFPVQVYRDSTWALPYVLVSKQFPRTPLATSRLR